MSKDKPTYSVIPTDNYENTCKKCGKITNIESVTWNKKEDKYHLLISLCECKETIYFGGFEEA